MLKTKEECNILLPSSGEVKYMCHTCRTGSKTGMPPFIIFLGFGICFVVFGVVYFNNFCRFSTFDFHIS